jgi:hypothetical protein
MRATNNGHTATVKALIGAGAFLNLKDSVSVFKRHTGYACMRRIPCTRHLVVWCAKVSISPHVIMDDTLFACTVF